MMLACRGEELKKGRTTVWNPLHVRVKIYQCKKREILLGTIIEDYSIITPVIGICIGAQEGREGGHEGEEEGGRWGRSGRRGGREVCGRRREEGAGCGSLQDEATRTSCRWTRRKTEEAEAARSQSKEMGRRGELAARRRSLRGRPRRASRWG